MTNLGVRTMVYVEKSSRGMVAAAAYSGGVTLGFGMVFARCSVLLLLAASTAFLA